MNRRGFLKSILAAGVAPYVSTAAGVLMPVRERRLWLYGDGVHDDTEALQALIDGKTVLNAYPDVACSFNGRVWLRGGTFLLRSALQLHDDSFRARDCHFIGEGLKGPMFDMDVGAETVFQGVLLEGGP